jgi:hypothetical protein
MHYSWSCEDPDGYTCFCPNWTDPNKPVRLDMPEQPVISLNTPDQLTQVNGT